jgi:hydrogenase maturation factor
MCMSRLHRVVAPPDPTSVLVEDMDGSCHRVSLLAFDGPPPHTGEWLVVNSGYALDSVDTDEAEAVMAELRVAAATMSPDDRVPTPSTDERTGGPRP